MKAALRDRPGRPAKALTAVPKTKGPRDHLLGSVQKFVNILVYRHCFVALRHLLRPWPNYSTLALEYEELLDSLKRVRAVARQELDPEEMSTKELKLLNSLIARIERRLERAF